MSQQHQYVIAINLLAALVAGLTSLHAARHRQTPGAAAFAGCMLAVSWWSLVTAIEWAIVDPLAKQRWSQASYLGIAPLAPLWFTFALTYDGRQAPGWRGLLAVIWALAAVTIVLAATVDHHTVLWTAVSRSGPEPGAPLVYHHGGYLWFQAAVSYALVVAGSVLIVKASLQAATVYRQQVLMLVAAVIVPVAGNILYLTGRSPLPGLDLTPVSFAASGMLVAIAMFRYGLLDLTPVAHETVFATLRDAVLVVDQQSRLIGLNPAAEELLGLDSMQVGQPLGDLLPTRPELAEALAVPPGQVRGLWSEPDHSRWLEVRSSPLLCPKGRDSGRVVIVRDDTLRKSAEEDRLAAERRLQESRHLQSLISLASGVAHDFNNIMTAVLGNTDLLLTRLPRTTPEHELADTVRSAALRAARLTSQLMQYAGLGRWLPERVDLRELILTSRRDWEQRLPAGVTLSFDLDPTTPAIEADPSQWDQLVDALVTNAIEAVDPDGGEITIRLYPRQLRAPLARTRPVDGELPPGLYAVLEVTDNGHGMDERTLARAFDPFFSTRFIGRGLGLAAVAGVIRSHDGAIEVESGQRGGTVVRCLTPPTLPPEPVSPAATS